jgi:hypothetical protein
MWLEHGGGQFPVTASLFQEGAVMKRRAARFGVSCVVLAAGCACLAMLVFAELFRKPA